MTLLRSDRARTREPRGGHAPASSPRGTADLPRSDRPRSAFKTPVRASLSILALSPSCSPFQNPGRAPELPSSPTRSAGVKLPHCHPISRFPPPTAPPWTPASLALTRGYRRQGKGRAWPPPFSPARTLPWSRGPPRHRAIPPFPSVRLSVVSTLAPPAPPGELTAGEHRSAELLPCLRVSDPWDLRAQP